MNEINKADIKNFILGGKAEFTLLQDATKDLKAVQVKYRITRPKDKQKDDNCRVFYVSTELCKDNDDVTTDARELKYQGYLYASEDRKDFNFKVGKKGIENYNAPAINGLIWVLKHDQIPNVVHIYHHGNCSVCGKKLTDARSLECGVGPVCRKRMGYE